MKEVEKKHFVGLFQQIPFENYIQSPLGLVPKDDNKTRLIFHLSYPRDPSQGKLVNSCTPKEKCSVKYPDFMEAVQLCIAEGKSCRICKSDMSLAFRNLGILLEHWPYLVMMVVSPLDGKTYFFVDKCLPFGASISCAIFQRFSNAVAHIVQFKTGKKLINYLDDYLFVALLQLLCNAQLQVFLQVCEQIKFPVSMDKTYWATTKLTFLGFLIDTINQIVAIPVDKINKARTMLESILSSKKATVHQIQKLCGFLNFLSRCVVPGRAFMRRLYSLTAGGNAKSSGKLKQHHHVHINQECRRDMQMWLTFLKHPSDYARGFMDYSSTVIADQIDFYTDASGAIGFGGVCESSWCYGYWEADFLAAKPSIEFLELYAVLMGVLLWIDRYQNRRVILFCDNQAVVSMINNTISSCRRCMVLIRLLVLKSMQSNVRIFANYVDTKSNFRADMLSRGKIRQFKQLDFRHDEQETPLAQDIWPVWKVWERNQ